MYIRVTTSIIYSLPRSNFDGGVTLEKKSLTPLKLGVATAATAYFLFTLHAMFTLGWIGEWEGLPPPMDFWIFITDISAGIFLVFRFIAGILAFTTVVLYFTKGLPQHTLYKLVRAILVLEALYWIGLLPSGIWGILFGVMPSGISLLITTGIPCMFCSIAIPIALFMLAAKLKPEKPAPTKLVWIAGLFYIVDFWLVNSGTWINVAFFSGKSADYLIINTEYLFSFILTIAGLLALAIYTAYAAVKSKWQLKTWPVGVILTSLGLYYFWNYLSWIFFGGWNDWYAWFLGHNLDLWLLTLPLVGLPLLLQTQKQLVAEEAPLYGSFVATA